MHKQAWVLLSLLAALLVAACAGPASAPEPAVTAPPEKEPADTSAQPELIYFHATW